MARLVGMLLAAEAMEEHRNAALCGSRRQAPLRDARTTPTSDEGLALNRAFIAISDPEIRGRIIAVMRTIADTVGHEAPLPRHD